MEIESSTGQAMVMAGWIKDVANVLRGKLSFHHKVLMALLALSWMIVGSFVIFQYNREKTFRTELLNTELQMHNDRIIEGIQKSEDIDSVVAQSGSPVKGLRLTIIGKNGKVEYDNNDKTPFPTTNHNDRPEVIEARKNGTGYSLGRKSESDDTDYFYSATLTDDGRIVRSAAPYDHSLRDFLKADRKFLWVMSILTIVASLAGYIITRRISTSIRRLNDFADKAGRGERIYDRWCFPDDELGNIAGNIVRLYVEREERHREAMRQEKDKIRMKRQLTNNINHELKTPVASIRICAELLRDHPELSEERRKEFADRICANATRLTTLLEDVASITRMEDGVSVIEKEPLIASDLINDIVESERPLTHMKITTDIPPVRIIGNRRLLESIFRNLIDNAKAYSGGTEIHISADCEGNFTFRDNGKGIPEEHLPHIFGRFYRIDKGRSREKGGTGLGLAIVRNAVGIHGGSIRVSNDNGLRFDFNLVNKNAT